jgi:hypothetical protein
MTEFHGLRAAAVTHAELRAQIAALTDDEQAISDTLEGASNFREVAVWAARTIKEREALAAGLKDYIGQLKTRLERMDANTDKMRELLATAMMEAGETSIKDAAVTLSARIGPARVVITDELALPQGYLKAKTTYTPDKDAIRSELEAGRPVVGAMLSNGSPVVTVRVK